MHIFAVQSLQGLGGQGLRHQHDWPDEHGVVDLQPLEHVLLVIQTLHGPSAWYHATASWLTS